jgi:parallel beta-helix repeat protein
MKKSIFLFILLASANYAQKTVTPTWVKNEINQYAIDSIQTWAETEALIEGMIGDSLAHYPQKAGDETITGTWNFNAATLTSLTILGTDTTLSPSRKYITSDTYFQRQLIDFYGDVKYIATNNAGGSSLKNSADSTYEITAADSLYSGVMFRTDFVLEANVNYYIRFMVKRKSGDVGAEWRAGYPIPASYRYVSFIPTDTWQVVEGVFHTDVVSDGIFICGSDIETNEVIKVKDFYIEKRRTLAGWKDDLATSLSVYDLVEVPIGTHIVTSTIVVPTGKRIYGVLGKSILQADTLITKVLDITNADNVIIDGITIKGDMADYGFNVTEIDSGIVDSLGGALNQDGIGTKVGIYIDGSDKVNITNCEVTNFDRAGIEVKRSGTNGEYGFRLINSLTQHCYIGLYLDSLTEYSNINSFTTRVCQIGAYITSGNLLLNGCMFTNNRVGLLMTNGLNDSHGSFTGCSFNHNNLYGLILDSLSHGQLFSNGQYWYCNIYMKGVAGVVFNGGLFYATTIYADGVYTGTDLSLITNAMFVSGIIEHNYNGHTSNLKLKNNWLMNGGDASALNN